MPWPSLYRASQVVAPKSLEELRPRKGMIALRCTLPGCRACRAFAAKSRDAHERALRARGVTAVLPWNCASPKHRDLAVGAGVDELPSYVLIPVGKGTIRVERP